MGKRAPIQKINGIFKGKHILSLSQFSPKDLEVLFALTKYMREVATNARPSSVLYGNIVVLLFYEPSSRTFGSFSAAVKQLGGQTVEIQNPQEFSSVAKGETLTDTIRVFEAYSDAIVIRHPVAGSAKTAAHMTTYVPIINAGDGVGEHPTQALLDLYTIFDQHKRLSNLKCVIAGDIKNGRTVHSLLKGLALYAGNTVYLLSPKTLTLEKKELKKYQKSGIIIHQIDTAHDIPKDCDVWYWTRVQKERFKNLEEYKKVNNAFIVDNKLLKRFGNSHMILMHPLPRVGEIKEEVDNDPRAVYLRTQVRNGMYIRMALLALVLRKA